MKKILISLLIIAIGGILIVSTQKNPAKKISNETVITVASKKANNPEIPNNTVEKNEEKNEEIKDTPPNTFKENSENIDDNVAKTDTVEKKDNSLDKQKFPLNIPAPELKGLTNWMNGSEISSIKELEGKVVLLHFWTFGCINCLRTIDYLNEWHEDFPAEDFIILGIHTPEFAYEKKPANVAKKLTELNIKWTVALDNDFETWRNYSNRYWPAKYLIDRQGKIRATHFGEGAYEEIKNSIQALIDQK